MYYSVEILKLYGYNIQKTYFTKHFSNIQNASVNIIPDIASVANRTKFRDGHMEYIFFGDLKLRAIRVNEYYCNITYLT